MKALFKAMQGEEGLVKTFQLNYGAWQVFDGEFLDLYKDLFIIENHDRPLFEMSPEVFDTKHGQKVKGHETYSMDALKQNLALIKSRLQDRVKVYLFFSRYHDMTETYGAMREEIFRIFWLNHDLLARGCTQVKVDWERYVDNPRDLDTLISWTRRLKNQGHHSFPVNNLCICLPKALSEAEISTCELLIFMLKDLEKHSRELFHILFRCLEKRVMNVLEQVISEVYNDRGGNVFTSLDHCDLLHNLEKPSVEIRPGCPGFPLLTT